MPGPSCNPPVGVGSASVCVDCLCPLSEQEDWNSNWLLQSPSVVQESLLYACVLGGFAPSGIVCDDKPPTSHRTVASTGGLADATD